MLHTLLIAAAVIGTITAFILLLVFVTKRETRLRKQKLKDAYKTLLAQHNLLPDYSKEYEHRILAIDTTRQIFAFVQEDEKLSSVVVDLNELSDFRLWKDAVQLVNREKGRNTSVEEHVNSVGISFIRRNGDTTNVPVYTEAMDGIEDKAPLSKEAEDWIQRIKNVRKRQNIQSKKQITQY